MRRLAPHSPGSKWMRLCTLEMSRFFLPCSGHEAEVVTCHPPGSCSGAQLELAGQRLITILYPVCALPVSSSAYRALSFFGSRLHGVNLTWKVERCCSDVVDFGLDFTSGVKRQRRDPLGACNEQRTQLLRETRLILERPAATIRVCDKRSPAILGCDLIAADPPRRLVKRDIVGRC